MEMLKATFIEEKSRAEGHCTGKYYMLGLLQNQILIISAIIPSVGCSWWFEYQKKIRLECANESKNHLVSVSKRGFARHLTF